MKTRIFYVVLVLFALLMPVKAMAQTAYAVYCSGNETLYFTNRNATLAVNGSFTPEAGGDALTITALWTNLEPTDEEDCPGWCERDDITHVIVEPSFATVQLQNYYEFFYDLSNLTDISGWEYFDVSAATSFSGMFEDCSSLTSVDFNYFSTPNLTSMAAMFSGCSNLISFSLGKINVENVTSVNCMFYGCTNLSSVNLSSVNLSQGVGRAYWHKLTNMGQVFENCQNLTSFDLGTNFWDAKPTTYARLFAGCSKLESVTVFGTGDPEGCLVSKWVTNMSYMFSGCTSLTSINMYGYDNYSETELALLTPDVTTMEGMFQNCTALTSLDLSRFNTAKVTNMKNMFNGCTALETITVGDNWSTTTVKATNNHKDMFTSCTSLVGGAGTTFSSSYTNKTYARVDGVDGNLGYLTYYTAFPSLTLSDEADNSSTISSANGAIRNVTINRTIYRDGNWNTICLPFKMTATEVTEVFGEGTQVMGFSSSDYDEDTKTLTLTFYTNSIIDENEPFLIKTMANTDLTSFTVNKRTVTYSASPSQSPPNGKATFYGTYSPTALVTASTTDDERKHLLYVGADGTLHIPAAYDANVAHSGELKGFRAYFSVSDGCSYAKARSAGLGADDMVSAIEIIVDGKKVEDDGILYNLQGIRMEKPAQGGIYIQNGKKVFIK